MSSVVIADAAERAIARDPSCSVIVQAPAGSGKTELLMQRYLALLASVEDPEEILAVTFTRKAAAEMRHRVISALYPQPDDKELLAETASLAVAALAHSEARNWRLNDFPGRLRIRTLDSVNSWLTGAAPVSGEGAALGTVTEKPAEMYELAARRTLELISEDSGVGKQVAVILSHLDNRADLFIRLFAQMLSHRDQWLPLIGSGDFDTQARELLEATLYELVSRELRTFAALLPTDMPTKLRLLLSYGATNQRVAKPDDPVCIWHELTKFPAAEPEALPYWRAMAKYLLTGSGTVRKSLNKNNGFPTAKDGGNAELLVLAKEVLADLALGEGVCDGLNVLAALPDPAYSDEQWEALHAMFQVLPVVAAQLTLIFRERGETDYIQIAGEAISALADEHGPTGLALRLDYRMSHILIDEFQDTSRSQYRLLEALTEGWADGDGRTLFVVGDPMQSIYRFRQAEVALFLRLADQGIGQIKLKQVQLTCNFRSDPTVVEWVNTVFDQLMPAKNDPAVGAVQFAPGTAVNSRQPGSTVELHTFGDPPRVDEASAIGELVAQKLADSESDTIGILVRTRNQARLIVPELRRRGVDFSGAGLEQPGETAVEQDLLALTRALTHFGDRTAWLALLRAPWCGLTLADLELLCGDEWGTAVVDQIRSAERVGKLSPDGQQRVAQLLHTIENILERRGVLPLRDWIEGAWQQLGGPATARGAHDLQLAEQFFVVLDEHAAGGSTAEAFSLHERLAQRNDTNAAESRVHLLTLYKAKGLEYDVVILPVLDGTTRGDDKAVLAWHEVTLDEGDSGYLMAPVEPAGADYDPVHKLIRQFQSEQAAYERDRLLYVATTRARRELHIFFGLKFTANGELATPRTGSLLQRLWPVIESGYADAVPESGTAEAREEWMQPLINRFVAGAQPVAAPVAVRGVQAAVAVSDDDNKITYDWAGSNAPRIGSVVHRCLQFIVETKQTDWRNEAAISLMLREEGVPPETLNAATEKVIAALTATVADDKGRWILAGHVESACELPVTMLVDGEPKRMVIDRTFIAEDGIRWIVDYKTSSHEGGGLDLFFAEEERRYSEQLLGYKSALQALEPEREIRTALYFPLLQAFRPVS
jgi:ATP-dependent helicase/nuclease subunit A